MLEELPIRLKVSGSDRFEGVRAISTTFRFHGWLKLDGGTLRIEWTGYARVQDVEMLSASDERLPLPAEALLVPLSRLRRAELRGGWWRPRLAIGARDSRALALVPSEEGGEVEFWYARRDGRMAATLAASLVRGIGEAADAGPEEVVHLSDTTPVTPPRI